MTQIGWFTTDWSADEVPGEPGKRRLSFGGTFYNRGAMPAMEMAKHGWDCVISHNFGPAKDGHIRVLDMNGDWTDPEIFYSQRWMQSGADEVMRKARSTGQIIVADLDDDFWSLGKTNIAYHTTDPVNNPEFNRDHYWKMLGACDAITVSTEAIRRRVQTLGVPTFVIRNAIDMERWPASDPGTDGMIGWVGGIQWRAHDLHILKPSVPAFLKEHDLPFYHGGDSQVPGVSKFWEQMGIDPYETKCVTAPLTHIAEYPRLWAPLNISLIPLEKVAFNQAKSWLKQLESCAAGIPYIVSHGFHEQDLLLSEGTAGRVAKNEKPQQWYDHMSDLLDPELRRKEGAINRTVAEKHDIKDRWRDWDNAYQEIVRLAS